MSARSSSVISVTQSWSLRNAGWPPSSSTKLRSPRVTTNGRPTGRQPWDTIVRTSAPSRSTPTAPSPVTSPSSARRFPPGRAAADASPPITARPGRSSSRRRRNASTGKLNGSARRSSAVGSWSRSGHPTTASPSGVDSSRSPTGVTRAPGSRAANTEIAGCSSISWAPPMIETAVAPMRTPGSRSWRSACTTSSKVPRKWGDAKHTTRSGSSPPSDSMISPAHSPTA